MKKHEEQQKNHGFHEKVENDGKNPWRIEKSGVNGPTEPWVFTQMGAGGPGQHVARARGARENTLGQPSGTARWDQALASRQGVGIWLDKNLARWLNSNINNKTIFWT